MGSTLHCVPTEDQMHTFGAVKGKWGLLINFGVYGAAYKNMKKTPEATYKCRGFLNSFATNHWLW